jgi:hypothetical protein
MWGCTEPSASVKKAESIMSLRATIASQFQQVAQEQHRKLSPLSDDLRLLQSG